MSEQITPDDDEDEEQTQEATPAEEDEDEVANAPGEPPALPAESGETSAL